MDRGDVIGAALWLLFGLVWGLAALGVSAVCIWLGLHPVLSGVVGIAVAFALWLGGTRIGDLHEDLDDD